MSVFTFCSEDEEGIGSYTGLVDVSNSPLKEEKHHVILQFSTDNGVTFADYTKIAIGQKYKVKAVHRDATNHVDTDINAAGCYKIDWSSANPKPNGEAVGDVAEFTMQESNSIVGKVTDLVPFNPASWAGTYTALEDYGTSTWGPYDVQFVQDATNPNRFHFDNFYDSGLDAYVEFDGATRTVKFPDGQSPDGEDLTDSSGTFDPCTGELVINLNYDGGEWIYRFTKK